MDYRGQAARIARAYGLDPNLFGRVIGAESNWNPEAVSPAGAIGLGQLMPATAAELGVDPRDPIQNMEGSARYLRQMLDRFGGNERLALAAYNAGPGRVEEYGGVPPFPETQNYLSRIFGGGQDGPAVFASTSGMQPQAEEPQGLLGALGIQRRDPEAGGETALPFYQRDTFRDFMGNLAIGLNELRLNPSETIPAVVTRNQERRQERATANRTVEELRRRGREDLASAVESGALSAREAATILFQTPERTAAQQNYEYLVAQGMDPEEAMQRAFSTGTTIDLGEQETEMAKGFGRGIAEETNQIVAAGQVASRSLGQIETLEYALQSAPQGMFGNIAGIANQFGIPLSDNMSELQIADAIISQLVPQQRPPGSGPMSDADLELFKRSLPRLANTPEGNRMIVATMRALAEYDIARGQIASELRLGRITPQEANDLYNALPNPVAPFVELQRQSGQPAAIDPAAATDELERLLGGS